MLKRILKFNHFLTSKLQEKNTLKRLSQMSPFGQELATAFEKTKLIRYSEETETIFKDLENFRDQMLNSNEEIDFSILEPNLKRTAKYVCERASSPNIWCKFFFFLTYHTNSASVLEIGTNLGVSGQYYLQALCLNGKDSNEINFTTLEGVDDLCEIAEERFGELTSRNHYSILCGLYKDTLPQIYKSQKKYDVVFIDGNHKFEPTLEYFNNLVENFSDKAIIIFDDINWSKEMVKAWGALKKSDHVYSIDFFKLGLLIIDKKNKREKPADFKLFISF